MSERMPPHEAPPNNLEVRRDALLLRIVELRERVKVANFDQELVAKELSELDTRVQQVQGPLDMDIFEKIFDSLEQMVDTKK